YGTLFHEAKGFPAAHWKIVPVEPKSLDRIIVIEMPGAAKLLASEQGTHLLNAPREGLTVVQVNVFAMDQDNAVERVEGFREKRRKWRTNIQQGLATLDDDAFPLLPVIRLYDPAHLTLDIRTGLAVRGLATPEEMRKFLLAQMPWHEELIASEMASDEA